MADIELTLNFECDGIEYRVEPYGVMPHTLYPLVKNKNEYKTCDVFVYASKGKLFARIEEDYYELIGQPTRLSVSIQTLQEERLRTGEIIVHKCELLEIYYDDDGRVVYDDSFHNQEYQAAPSKPIAEAKSPQDSIVEVCDSIKELLLEKNRKYGNSALNPCRVFSKADSVEQLKVRIDDKINRIKNEQNDEDEDVVKDLIGYLVLLVIARGNGHAEEEI